MNRARGALCLCAGLWSACQALAPIPQGEHEVEVLPIRARFEDSDRGEVVVPLRLALEERATALATSAVWELWLEGKRFATGTQALQALVPAGPPTTVVLTLPVAFRRVPGTPSTTREVQLAVKGSLTTKVGRSRRDLTFRARQWVRVTHPPSMLGMGDDD